ncbi:MAG: 5-(carboxyamino)imidazole ribonucleotide mutase [Acidobacteriota bacterium]|nr:MAG: 5-(carboxyamino)imidazole ribonucleotide mutase [Acidobacteriota bacterium]
MAAPKSSARRTGKTRTPRVGIMMGSASDRPVMAECEKTLESLGVACESVTLSAHRTPREVQRYVRAAPARGVRVLVAGAGMAAHLAGAVAAHTTLPVVGVPLDSSALNGLDALLSTAQMPPGIPVATMAVGKAGARNAALFAASILALDDAALARRLRALRSRNRKKVLSSDPATKRILKMLKRRKK